MKGKKAQLIARLKKATSDATAAGGQNEEKYEKRRTRKGKSTRRGKAAKAAKEAEDKLEKEIGRQTRRWKTTFRFRRFLYPPHDTKAGDEDAGDDDVDALLEADALLGSEDQTCAAMP